MARYLRLSRDLYGIGGLIPLTQGDDWSLAARVVDLVGGTELDQDITGYTGASAFFPAATGGFIQGTVTVTDPLCGQVTIGLPQASSSGAALSDTGAQLYIELQEPAGLQTLYPYDSPLQISARGMVQT